MKAQTRLDALEDGTEKTGSFDDMLTDDGHFVRFVDDSGDLRDVDRLLALWDEAAEAAENNQGGEIAAGKLKNGNF